MLQADGVAAMMRLRGVGGEAKRLAGEFALTTQYGMTLSSPGRNHGAMRCVRMCFEVCPVLEPSADNRVPLDIADAAVVLSLRPGPIGFVGARQNCTAAQRSRTWR